MLSILLMNVFDFVFNLTHFLIMGKHKDFRHVHHTSLKKKDKSRSNHYEGFLKGLEEVVQAELVSHANAKKMGRKERKDLERLPLLPKAVYLGCERAVDNILETGENINAQVQGGKTPLIIAVENGYPSIVQKLLKKGADPKLLREDGRNALMIAVANNDNRSFMLLWNFWDKSNFGELNHGDSRGFTILTIASEQGHTQLTNFLLRLGGVEIDKQTIEGKTPLMYSVVRGQTKTVEKFLESGSDIVLEDKDGTTAICLAIIKNETEIKNLLIESLDRNSRDTYVKKRIELLWKPRTEECQATISFYKDVLFFVILEIRRGFDDGIELLKKHKVFDGLLQCLRRHQQDCGLLKVGFHLAACIMQDKDNRYIYVVEELAEQYIVAKGADFALKIMHVHRVKNLGDLRSAAFKTIQAGVQSPSGRVWLKTNFFQVSSFVKEFKQNFRAMEFWQEDEGKVVRVLFERFFQLFHLLEKDLKVDANGGNEVLLENPIPATQMVERNKSMGDVDPSLLDQQWSIVSHSKSRNKKPPALQPTKKGSDKKNKATKLKTRILRRDTIKSVPAQPNLKYIPGLCTDFPPLKQSDATFSVTGYADALKKNLQNENVAKSGVEIAKHDILEASKANESSCSTTPHPPIKNFGDWIKSRSNSQSEKIDVEDARPDSCLHKDKRKELQNADGTVQGTNVFMSGVKDFSNSLNAINTFSNAKSSVREDFGQRIQTDMREEPAILVPQERSSTDGYRRAFPMCETFDPNCQGDVTPCMVPSITFKNSLVTECFKDGQPKTSHFQTASAMELTTAFKGLADANLSCNTISTGNGDESEQLNYEYVTDANHVKTGEKCLNYGQYPNLNFSSKSHSMFDSNCSTKTNIPIIGKISDRSFDEKSYNEDRVINKRIHEENQTKHSKFIKKENGSAVKDDLSLLESKTNRYQNNCKILRAQSVLTQNFHTLKKSNRSDGCLKVNKHKWEHGCLYPELDSRKQRYSIDNSENQSVLIASPERSTIRCLESSSNHGLKKKLYSEIMKNSGKDTYYLNEPNRTTTNMSRSKKSTEIINDGSFGDFKYIGKKSAIKNVLKRTSLLSKIQKEKPIRIQKYIELYQRLILHQLGQLCSLMPETSAKPRVSCNINYYHVSSKNVTPSSQKENCTKQRQFKRLPICDNRELSRDISPLTLQNEWDAILKQNENISKYTQNLCLHTRSLSKQLNAIRRHRRGKKASKVLDRKKKLSKGTTSPISDVDSGFVGSGILHGYTPQFINCEPDSKWYSVLRRIESCFPLASLLMGSGRTGKNLSSDGAVHELVCSFGKVTFSTKEEHALRQSALGTYVGLMGNGNPVVVRQFKKSPVESVKLLTKKHRIQHRNIAAFYCLCCSPRNQDLFAVTELTEYSLTEYLQVAKRNFHGKVLVRQLLEALQYLHRRQIVHGFLKPSNVMVTLDYQLKISDFYLLDVNCLQYGFQNKRNDKTPGAIVHRVSDCSWRPCELIAATTSVEARKHLTASSDIQMAGMLVYYILSGGKHPFGSSDPQCQENILRGLPELNFPIDIESRDLISGMIQRVPSERPIINLVLKHPYLWDIEKRFKFLISVARKIEFFTRKPTKIAEALEDSCIEARSWTDRVHVKLLEFIGQCTSKALIDGYADLLVFLVSINDSFETMPREIKFLVQQPSLYASRTFPSTFMSVYSVMRGQPVAQRQMAIQAYF